MVSSFDYDALTYLEKNYPEITTVLISFYVPMPEELVTDGFAVDFAYLTENKAERIRESEKLFIIWTINNDSFKILDALAFNADYIITDSPEILRYIKNTVITFLEEEDI
jgi:glycerophosphoryl diester phosphodiesterase